MEATRVDERAHEAENSGSATRRRAPAASLYQQVKLARFWLPVTIVGVVLVHQLAIVPLGSETWRFWAQLLFYAILGPAVTFVTLSWIAGEVHLREEAQDEMARLYRELQASHELLGAIQGVTERFVAAPDLETALSTASRGITDVSGATGALVMLGASGSELTSDFGLGDLLREHGMKRGRAMLDGRALPEEVEVAGERHWVLSSRLVWAGNAAGSVHAYYAYPPSAKERESFGILASEFSAAAEAGSSRTRDLVTLFEVDRSIRAEGNLERLLDTLLVHMVARVSAESGGVYLLDDDGLLHLRSAHGLMGGTPSRSLKIGTGLAGSVAASREPRILKSVEARDRATGSPFLVDAGSAVALPLLGEGVLLGVVVLAHGEKTHFDETALPFLGLLAGQVSLAVRNARAYLQSEELAIAEERARIAREIHDGVAQSLAFAALKLDLVDRLLPSDPAKAAAEVSSTRATIRETIKEVRRSIFALRPVELERHGFMETLRRYLADYGQQNEMQVELEEHEIPLLTTKAEAVLFRIFQEAMNNVAKHAAARRVTVSVGREADGQAFVRVRDDGRGFDLATVSDRVTSAGGLGLRQMRERVEARGGRLQLESAPGSGTTVIASVPE
ncbi:MAG: GAF domain-containing sensor histidine kinase [Trueperaceae bacterium]